MPTPGSPENFVVGSADLDDGLTSLHWLQNFHVAPRSSGRFQSSSCHQLQRFHSPCDTATTALLQAPVKTSTSCRGLLAHGQPLAFQTLPQEDLDYRTNCRAKPPYSRVTLIGMAIQAGNAKATLSSICSWIRENFAYYRCAESCWQNSIRHNLSVNKCFVKVPRQKGERGKGGYWQIDPQSGYKFVNGVFRRQQMTATHTPTGHFSPSCSSHHTSRSISSVPQPATGPAHKQGQRPIEGIFENLDVAGTQGADDELSSFLTEMLNGDDGTVGDWNCLELPRENQTANDERRGFDLVTFINQAASDNDQIFQNIDKASDLDPS